MTPIEFEQANDVLKCPPDMPDCTDLPICKAMDSLGNACVISCWQLSEEEIQQLIKSKKLYVYFSHITHPPLSLLTKSPFN